MRKLKGLLGIALVMLAVAGFRVYRKHAGGKVVAAPAAKPTPATKGGHRLAE